MKALAILLMIVLVACSPQKRLNRLVRNNPELIQKDTLHIVDTVQFVTTHVKQDTIVSFERFKSDTLIITKENLRIKTFYNYQTDSIYVFGECQSDTITKIIERNIPVDKYIVKKESKINLILICIVLALLLIMMIFSGNKLGR